ncbi:hypothetical protein [Streptomyces sp. NPDC059994]|uniref:hypothetical protein n=1 Tax=Streptomyces sp. NPDC059994 TaxID=3347029 RepID=UPI0036A3E548
MAGELVVNDFGKIFEKHLGATLGKTTAGALGREYGEAFVTNWAGKGGWQGLTRSLGEVLEPYAGKLGTTGMQAFSHDLPEALVHGIGKHLPGDAGYKIGNLLGNIGSDAGHQAVTEGMYNLLFSPEHEFKVTGFTPVAGAVGGLLGHGIAHGINALRGAGGGGAPVVPPEVPDLKSPRTGGGSGKGGASGEGEGVTPVPAAEKIATVSSGGTEDGGGAARGDGGAHSTPDTDHTDRNGPDGGEGQDGPSPDRERRDSDADNDADNEYGELEYLNLDGDDRFISPDADDDGIGFTEGDEGPAPAPLRPQTVGAGGGDGGGPVPVAGSPRPSQRPETAAAPAPAPAPAPARVPTSSGGPDLSGARPQSSADPGGGAGRDSEGSGPQRTPDGADNGGPRVSGGSDRTDSLGEHWPSTPDTDLSAPGPQGRGEVLDRVEKALAEGDAPTALREIATLKDLEVRSRAELDDLGVGLPLASDGPEPVRGVREIADDLALAVRTDPAMDVSAMVREAREHLAGERAARTRADALRSRLVRDFLDGAGGAGGRGSVDSDAGPRRSGAAAGADSDEALHRRLDELRKAGSDAPDAPDQYAGLRDRLDRLHDGGPAYHGRPARLEELRRARQEALGEEREHGRHEPQPQEPDEADSTRPAGNDTEATPEDLATLELLDSLDSPGPVRDPADDGPEAAPETPRPQGGDANELDALLDELPYAHGDGDGFGDLDRASRVPVGLPDVPGDAPMDLAFPEVPRGRPAGRTDARVARALEHLSSQARKAGLDRSDVRERVEQINQDTAAGRHSEAAAGLRSLQRDVAVSGLDTRLTDFRRHVDGGYGRVSELGMRRSEWLGHAVDIETSVLEGRPAHETAALIDTYERRLGALRAELGKRGGGSGADRSPLPMDPASLMDDGALNERLDRLHRDHERRLGMDADSSDLWSLRRGAEMTAEQAARLDDEYRAELSRLDGAQRVERLREMGAGERELEQWQRRLERDGLSEELREQYERRTAALGDLDTRRRVDLTRTDDEREQARLQRRFDELRPDDAGNTLQWERLQRRHDPLRMRDAEADADLAALRRRLEALGPRSRPDADAERLGDQTPKEQGEAPAVPDRSEDGSGSRTEESADFDARVRAGRQNLVDMPQAERERWAERYAHADDEAARDRLDRQHDARVKELRREAELRALREADPVGAERTDRERAAWLSRFDEAAGDTEATQKLIEEYQAETRVLREVGRNRLDRALRAPDSLRPLNDRIDQALDGLSTEARRAAAKDSATLSERLERLGRGPGAAGRDLGDGVGEDLPPHDPDHPSDGDGDGGAVVREQADQDFDDLMRARLQALQGPGDGSDTHDGASQGPSRAGGAEGSDIGQMSRTSERTGELEEGEDTLREPFSDDSDSDTGDDAPASASTRPSAPAASTTAKGRGSGFTWNSLEESERVIERPRAADADAVGEDAREPLPVPDEPESVPVPRPGPAPVTSEPITAPPRPPRSLDDLSADAYERLLYSVRRRFPDLGDEAVRQRASEELDAVPRAVHASDDPGAERPVTLARDAVAPRHRPEDLVRFDDGAELPYNLRSAGHGALAFRGTERLIEELRADHRPAPGALEELRRELADNPHTFLHGRPFTFTTQDGGRHTLTVEAANYGDWSRYTPLGEEAKAAGDTKVDTEVRSRPGTGDSKSLGATRSFGATLPLGPGTGTVAPYASLGVTVRRKEPAYQYAFEHRAQTSSTAVGKDGSHVHVDDLYVRAVAAPLDRSGQPSGPVRESAYRITGGLVWRAPDSAVRPVLPDRMPEHIRFAPGDRPRLFVPLDVAPGGDLYTWARTAFPEAGPDSAARRALDSFFSPESLRTLLGPATEATVLSEPLPADPAGAHWLGAAEMRLRPVSAALTAASDTTEVKKADTGRVSAVLDRRSTEGGGLTGTLGPAVTVPGLARQLRVQAGGALTWSTQRAESSFTGNTAEIGRTLTTRGHSGVYEVRYRVEVRRLGETWRSPRADGEPAHLTASVLMARDEARRLARWRRDLGHTEAAQEPRPPAYLPTAERPGTFGPHVVVALDAVAAPQDVGGEPVRRASLIQRVRDQVLESLWERHPRLVVRPDQDTPRSFREGRLLKDSAEADYANALRNTHKLYQALSQPQIESALERLTTTGLRIQLDRVGRVGDSGLGAALKEYVTVEVRARVRGPRFAGNQHDLGVANNVLSSVRADGASTRTQGWSGGLDLGVLGGDAYGATAGLSLRRGRQRVYGATYGPQLNPDGGIGSTGSQHLWTYDLDFEVSARSLRRPANAARVATGELLAADVFISHGTADDLLGARDFGGELTLAVPAALAATGGAVTEGGAPVRAMSAEQARTLSSGRPVADRATPALLRGPHIVQNVLAPATVYRHARELLAQVSGDSWVYRSDGTPASHALAESFAPGRNEADFADAAVVGKHVGELFGKTAFTDITASVSAWPRLGRARVLGVVDSGDVTLSAIGSVTTGAGHSLAATRDAGVTVAAAFRAKQHDALRTTGAYGLSWTPYQRSTTHTETHALGANPTHTVAYSGPLALVAADVEWHLAARSSPRGLLALPTTGPWVRAPQGRIVSVPDGVLIWMPLEEAGALGLYEDGLGDPLPHVPFTAGPLAALGSFPVGSLDLSGALTRFRELVGTGLPRHADWLEPAGLLEDQLGSLARRSATLSPSGIRGLLATLENGGATLRLTRQNLGSSRSARLTVSLRRTAFTPGTLRHDAALSASKVTSTAHTVTDKAARGTDAGIRVTEGPTVPGQSALTGISVALDDRAGFSRSTTLGLTLTESATSTVTHGGISVSGESAFSVVFQLEVDGGRHRLTSPPYPLGTVREHLPLSLAVPAAVAGRPPAHHPFAPPAVSTRPTLIDASTPGALADWSARPAYRRARELFAAGPESLAVARIEGIAELREAGAFVLDAAGPLPRGGIRPPLGTRAGTWTGTALGQGGDPHRGRGALTRPGAAAAQVHADTVSHEVLAAYFRQVLTQGLTLGLHDTDSAHGGFDATLRLFANIDLDSAVVVALDPDAGIGGSRRALGNHTHSGDTTQAHQPGLTAGPSLAPVSVAFPPGTVTVSTPGWPDTAIDGLTLDRRTSTLTTIKPPAAGAVLVRMDVDWRHVAEVTRRTGAVPQAVRNLLPDHLSRRVGPPAAAEHTVTAGIHVWLSYDLARRHGLLTPELDAASTTLKKQTKAFTEAAKAEAATARSLRDLTAELTRARADVERAWHESVTEDGTPDAMAPTSSAASAATGHGTLPAAVRAAAARLASREERLAELQQQLADRRHDLTSAQTSLSRARTWADETLLHHSRPPAQRTGNAPAPFDADAVLDDIVVAQPSAQDLADYPLPAPGPQHLAGPATTDPLTAPGPLTEAEVSEAVRPWFAEHRATLDPLMARTDLTDAAVRERDNARAWARTWHAADARYRAALADEQAARERLNRAHGKTPRVSAERQWRALEPVREAVRAYDQVRERLELSRSEAVAARARFLAARDAARTAAGAPRTAPRPAPWRPDPMPATARTATTDEPRRYTALLADPEGRPLTLLSPDGERVLDIVETPAAEPVSGTSFLRSLVHAVDTTAPHLLDTRGLRGDDLTSTVRTVAHALADQLLPEGELTPWQRELADTLAPGPSDRFTAQDVDAADITLTAAERQELAAHHRLPRALTLTPEQRLALARLSLLRPGDGRVGDRVDAGWNHAAADLLPVLAARLLGLNLTVVRGDLGHQTFTPPDRLTPLEVTLHVQDHQYRPALGRTDTQAASREGDSLVLADGSRYVLHPGDAPHPGAGSGEGGLFEALAIAHGRGESGVDLRARALGGLPREVVEEFPDLGEDVLRGHPFTEDDLAAAGVVLDGPGWRRFTETGGLLPEDTVLGASARRALSRRLFPGAGTTFTEDELRAAGREPGAPFTRGADPQSSTSSLPSGHYALTPAAHARLSDSERAALTALVLHRPPASAPPAMPRLIHELAVRAVGGLRVVGPDGRVRTYGTPTAASPLLYQDGDRYVATRPAADAAEVPRPVGRFSSAADTLLAALALNSDRPAALAAPDAQEQTFQGYEHVESEFRLGTAALVERLLIERIRDEHAVEAVVSLGGGGGVFAYRPQRPLQDLDLRLSLPDGIDAAQRQQIFATVSQLVNPDGGVQAPASTVKGWFGGVEVSVTFGKVPTDQRRLKLAGDETQTVPVTAVSAPRLLSDKIVALANRKLAAPGEGTQGQRPEDELTEKRRRDALDILALTDKLSEDLPAERKVVAALAQVGELGDEVSPKYQPLKKTAFDQAANQLKRAVEKAAKGGQAQSDFVPADWSTLREIGNNLPSAARKAAAPRGQAQPRGQSSGQNRPQNPAQSHSPVQAEAQSQPPLQGQDHSGPDAEGSQKDPAVAAESEQFFLLADGRRIPYGSVQLFEIRDAQGEFLGHASHSADDWARREDFYHRFRTTTDSFRHYRVREGADRATASPDGTQAEERLPWRPETSGTDTSRPYFFDAHGAQDGVVLRLKDAAEPADGTAVSEKVVVDGAQFGRFLTSLTKGPAERGDIVLVACKTGQTNDGSSVVAEAAKAAPGRRLYAPDSDVGHSPAIEGEAPDGGVLALLARGEDARGRWVTAYAPGTDEASVQAATGASARLERPVVTERAAAAVTLQAEGDTSTDVRERSAAPGEFTVNAARQGDFASRIYEGLQGTILEHEEIATRPGEIGYYTSPEPEVGAPLGMRSSFPVTESSQTAPVYTDLAHTPFRLSDLQLYTPRYGWDAPPRYHASLADAQEHAAIRRFYEKVDLESFTNFGRSDQITIIEANVGPQGGLLLYTRTGGAVELGREQLAHVVEALEPQREGPVVLVTAGHAILRHASLLLQHEMVLPSGEKRMLSAWPAGVWEAILSDHFDHRYSRGRAVNAIAPGAGTSSSRPTPLHLLPTTATGQIGAADPRSAPVPHPVSLAASQERVRSASRRVYNRTLMSPEQTEWVKSTSRKIIDITSGSVFSQMGRSAHQVTVSSRRSFTESRQAQSLRHVSIRLWNALGHLHQQMQHGVNGDKFKREVEVQGALVHDRLVFATNLDRSVEWLVEGAAQAGGFWNLLHWSPDIRYFLGYTKVDRFETLARSSRALNKLAAQVSGMDITEDGGPAQGGNAVIDILREISDKGNSARVHAVATSEEPEVLRALLTDAEHAGAVILVMGPDGAHDWASPMHAEQKILHLLSKADVTPQHIPSSVVIRGQKRPCAACWLALTNFQKQWNPTAGHSGHDIEFNDHIGNFYQQSLQTLARHLPHLARNADVLEGELRQRSFTSAYSYPATASSGQSSAAAPPMPGGGTRSYETASESESEWGPDAVVPRHNSMHTDSMPLAPRKVVVQREPGELDDLATEYQWNVLALMTNEELKVRAKRTVEKETSEQTGYSRGVWSVMKNTVLGSQESGLKSQFARFLGVAPSAVTKWMKKDFVEEVMEPYLVLDGLSVQDRYTIVEAMPPAFMLAWTECLRTDERMPFARLIELGGAELTSVLGEMWKRDPAAASSLEDFLALEPGSVSHLP